ncbi:DUF736 domain-containing protein (plasmid) [Sphingobium fuliginis]|jgi:uncharacterized protein (DUF736 family)|uniref:DUF736 domain-containing protein n=1 Tax=Sphingobium fuliginis (strain ATCC 27551) TaxID=336203 RepID=A0A7M2GQA2_SPHSA|nr:MULTISPECIES: DUF736 domain-containing protein [Sphingobium]QOT74525.1 DUF736 domain-containing protein [Sphingobium fuliginis]
MNIGSISQNESGTFLGKISTLTVSLTIALREVHSTNPRAPKYEIFALSAAKQWVQVGAFFELPANGTGEMFLNGKIEDPSFDKPLYISAFRQDDGSYNIVWSRPNRKRDVDAAMAPRQADSGLPPLPGGEAAPAGGDGLGESTAQGGFGEEQPRSGRGKRQQQTGSDETIAA